MDPRPALDPNYPAYTGGVRQVPLIIEPEPDDPGGAIVMVDGTVAGRPYRFVLDTGAARTQLETDEYTAALATVADDSSAGAFGGSVTHSVVTITDLAVGPLRAATLAVRRAEPGGPHQRNLLGMDVLRRYRCHFRLDAGVLELDQPRDHPADQVLRSSSRGHPYVDVRWPGVTGHACWDTGSSATIVNRDFWRAHPELFEETGTTSGTDGSGTQAETPTLLMAGPVIGQRAFADHRAVAVNLSGANSTTDYPMDLILGYPTLRQADWLFDFPAQRWTLTS
jgi:predicted aspartyl protease